MLNACAKSPPISHIRWITNTWVDRINLLIYIVSHCILYQCSYLCIYCFSVTVKEKKMLIEIDWKLYTHKNLIVVLNHFQWWTYNLFGKYVDVTSFELLNTANVVLRVAVPVHVQCSALLFTSTVQLFRATEFQQ